MNLQDCYSAPHYRFGLQFLFWLLTLCGFSILLLTIMAPAQIFLRSVMHLVGIAILMGVNTYFLFPRYFAPKRYSTYLIHLILFIILAVVVLYFSEFYFFGEFSPLSKKVHSRFPSTDPRSLATTLFLPPILLKSLFFFFATMGSTLLESLHLQQRNERRANEIAVLHTATELRLLKNQINPHFLFNTLNNLYGLSLLQPDKTPEMILSLSEFLRYLLYECSSDTVSIAKEVDYIRRYIDLQQLKVAHRLRIDLDFGATLREQPIAPLLFLPFIENAYKHSNIENDSEAWIEIDLSENNDGLCFQVKNSTPESVQQYNQVGGIGLPNVKRRLELLYPDHHELSLRAAPGIFAVTLILTQCTPKHSGAIA